MFTLCRASAIMHELRSEQTKDPLPYPEFAPGDALEVKMLPHSGADKPVRSLLCPFPS